MAAAARPARAAATFFFFDVVRRFPSFPATFDASAFAVPPARFAVFFARFADFLMLAMHDLRREVRFEDTQVRPMYAAAGPLVPAPFPL